MTEVFQFESFPCYLFPHPPGGALLSVKRKIFNMFQITSIKLAAEWEMFPQMFPGIHKSWTSKILELFTVLFSTARTTQDKLERQHNVFRVSGSKAFVIFSASVYQRLYLLPFHSYADFSCNALGN